MSSPGKKSIIVGITRHTIRNRDLLSTPTWSGFAYTEYTERGTRYKEGSGLFYETYFLGLKTLAVLKTQDKQ